MNWRHGFFRLWLLLALLWWGSWGVYFVSSGAFDPPTPLPPSPALPEGFVLDGPGESLSTREEPPYVIAIAPPFVVFILGWAIAWVLTGFKQGKP